MKNARSGGGSSARRAEISSREPTRWETSSGSGETSGLSGPPMSRAMSATSATSRSPAGVEGGRGPKIAGTASATVRRCPTNSRSTSPHSR